MRGIQVRQFGGPDVLEAVELPDPVPGPAQAVIEVAYADVIFLETQVRRDGAFFAPDPVHHTQLVLGALDH